MPQSRQVNPDGSRSRAFMSSSAQPRRDRQILVVDRQVCEQPPASSQQDAGEPRNGPGAFGALAAAVGFDVVGPEDGDWQNLAACRAPLLFALAAFACDTDLVAALDAQRALATLLLDGLVPVVYASAPLAVVGMTVLVVDIAMEVVERLEAVTGRAALHGFTSSAAAAFRRSCCSVDFRSRASLLRGRFLS